MKNDSAKTILYKIEDSVRKMHCHLENWWWLQMKYNARFPQNFLPLGFWSCILCSIFKEIFLFQKWPPFWIFDKNACISLTIFFLHKMVAIFHCLGLPVFAEQKQVLCVASDSLVKDKPTFPKHSTNQNDSI